jgi:DUF1009 family protein
MGRLGIIAGSGNVPAAAFEKARTLGRDPLLIALAETGAPADLAAAGLPAEAFSVARPQAVLDRFRDAGAREVLIVGKVPKQLHFADLDFDARALAILSRMQTRADGDLFAALAVEFEGEGIAVVGQSAYLGDFLIPPGVLCGAGVPRGRKDLARRALTVARKVARLDIGQTVVLREGAVVAVEGFEHTGETIRRAGTLAGRGLWVAKAARPRQDDRFDVPAIGEETVRVMGEVGATLLLVEAGRVFLFDRDQAVRAADGFGISIVAL